MEIKFTTLVLNVISGLLPGGAMQFLKDGGSVYTVGHPSKEVVVFHPGLPENLKQKLLEIAEKNQQVVTLLEHTNFEGQTSEEITAAFDRIYLFLFRIHPDARVRRCERSNVITVHLPSVVKKEEDIINFLTGALTGIEGLYLSFITFKDGFKRVVSDRMVVKTEQERGVITDADLTDLKISLGAANTVEEFLRQIGG